MELTYCDEILASSSIKPPLSPLAAILSGRNPLFSKYWMSQLTNASTSGCMGLSLILSFPVSVIVPLHRFSIVVRNLAAVPALLMKRGSSGTVSKPLLPVITNKSSSYSKEHAFSCFKQ
eukprot:NODE_524_length_7257_cov_0.465912.p4 type:complete len:119 gc:universal NODE_524_length_7257_cov_0.465912:2507-2151(-)